MAENKKSFVLYSDMNHTVNQLPDDVAGRLLKHILAYVNDENPETKEILVNVVFEPIKQQMKRDLKKWEDKRQKYVDAGRKSGEARRNKNQDITSQGEQKIEVVIIEQNEQTFDNVQQSLKKKPSKKESESIEIVLPTEFDNEEFRAAWIEWKEYKLKEHKFQYRSLISESKALKNLSSLSLSNTKTAIQIINQSIANGWQGFFKLNTSNNGTAQQPISGTPAKPSIDQQLAASNADFENRLTKSIEDLSNPNP